jgi:hypothetical protein
MFREFTPHNDTTLSLSALHTATFIRHFESNIGLRSWNVRISEVFYSITFMSDPRRGFGLDIGFIDHLQARLGIISNYSATANLHKSQITTAPAKYFPACSVFTNRSLATASNSGDSLVYAHKSSLNDGSTPTVSFLHSPNNYSARLSQKISFILICVPF